MCWGRLRGTVALMPPGLALCWSSLLSVYLLCKSACCCRILQNLWVKNNLCMLNKKLSLDSSRLKIVNLNLMKRHKP